jgi:hypothetical protein
MVKILIYKDAWSLAQAEGLPSLIYHEPVLAFWLHQRFFR